MYICVEFVTHKMISTFYLHHFVFAMSLYCVKLNEISDFFHTISTLYFEREKPLFQFEILLIFIQVLALLETSNPHQINDCVNGFQNQ